MRKRSHCSSIALDTGTASTAVCQLMRKGAAVRVHRWGVAEDPLRARPAAHEDQLPPQERVARLVSQSGLHGRVASLALKPPDVSLHPATVPEKLDSAPREQWLTMLRFEAARQMRSEPDALEIDFWRLPARNRSGANVMIAATQRDTLRRWLEFLEALGLMLGAVDVVPCALTRAAWLLRDAAGGRDVPGPESLWGVLDIGYSGALLTVAVGSQCVYARPLTTGGDGFTLAIVEALSVDYRSAEILKRNYLAAGAGAEADAAKHEAEAALSAGSLRELSPVLRTVFRARIRQLAGEIERAFTYPMQNYPDATPTTLYLTGGGARLSGLAEALRELLGVAVLPLDPLARIAPQARNESAGGTRSPSNLACCVGLALGDLQ